MTKKPLDPSLCFSIVLDQAKYKRKVLDLECPDSETRDLWHNQVRLHTGFRLKAKGSNSTVLEEYSLIAGPR